MGWSQAVRVPFDPAELFLEPQLAAGAGRGHPRLGVLTIVIALDRQVAGVVVRLEHQLTRADQARATRLRSPTHAQIVDAATAG